MAVSVPGGRLLGSKYIWLLRLVFSSGTSQAIDCVGWRREDKGIGVFPSVLDTVSNLGGREKALIFCSLAVGELGIHDGRPNKGARTKHNGDCDEARFTGAVTKEHIVQGTMQSTWHHVMVESTYPGIPHTQ
jgi:hypothetical protein